VPVSRTEVYSTTGDSQRIVDIKVYQGESRLVKNNTFLDQYTVDGIPPAPAGNEKVAITFTYDVNGILNVKTKIVSTGKEAALTVDKSGQRMSEKERSAARERLEREWGEEPAPKAAAMGGMASGGAQPEAVNGSAQVPNNPLLAAAQEKLGALDASNRQKLEALMGRLRAASSAGDPKEAARLDQELTNFLFELD
jgi:molecular chaperone DnaK